MKPTLMFLSVDFQVVGRVVRATEFDPFTLTR